MSSPIASQRVRHTTYLRIPGKIDSPWTLYPGTLVRYISKDYLPAHCVDRFGDYNETYEAAVYTCYGIGLVYVSDLDWNIY
jgi:hypothetical protein